MSLVKHLNAAWPGKQLVPYLFEHSLMFSFPVLPFKIGG